MRAGTKNFPLAQNQDHPSHANGKYCNKLPPFSALDFFAVIPA
jgi:hypothetical protein